MKKSYQAPALFAETFVMCEHVAAGCKVQPGEADATYITPDSCAYIDRNIVIYTSGSEACKNMDLGLFATVEEFLETVQCYNMFSTKDSMFVS